MYGVTPQGFVSKPYSELVEETNGDVLGQVQNVDLSPDQPLGQVIGIICGKLAEVWELGEVAYDNTNRGNAEGDQLDNIGSITGTIRLGESPSLVPVVCVFNAAGTHAPGSLVISLVGLPSIQFANQDTIVVPTTGDNPGNISPTNTWSNAGNPFLFASTELGPDYGNAVIAAGGAGQLTVIVPVAGWVSGTGQSPVTLGTLVEEDADYRVRQEDDLSAAGNNTLDATRAAILEGLQAILVVGAAVEMYENTSLQWDPVTGLPPKSYMAVIWFGGGSPSSAVQTAIATAMWANHPGGMQDFGSSSLTVVDSQGTTRTVYYQEASLVLVSASMTVYVANLAILSPTEKSALQSAVSLALTQASQGQSFTLYGTTVTPGEGAVTTLSPGQDVIASAFKSIAQGQSGVVDVQSFVLTVTSGPGTVEASGNVSVPISSNAQLSVPTSSITLAQFNPDA